MIKRHDHGAVVPHSHIYFGQVSHCRVRDAAHRFAYRIFSLYLDLDELPELSRRSWLLSHNRWNILSFLDRDHGPRDGAPLRPWIERQMQEAGLGGSLGPIRILCFPRLLGYVFNPLSVWFMYSTRNRLRAIMYEVSNTFGQHHCYLLPIAESHRTDEIIEQSCRKTLHVSPFIAMAAEYRFRLREPGERLWISILEADSEGVLMTATHRAMRAQLTDRNLFAAVLRYPLVTIKVIAAIHWQALHLWLKGVPVLRRPQPPQSLVSFGDQPDDQHTRLAL